MNQEIKELLTPALQEATDEEIKQIGFAAFGHNLSYVVSMKKDLYAQFQETYELENFTYIDRKKFSFMVTYVEAYDRGETGTVSVEGVKIDAPTQRPTPQEIIELLKPYDEIAARVESK